MLAFQASLYMSWAFHSIPHAFVHGKAMLEAGRNAAPVGRQELYARMQGTAKLSRLILPIPGGMPGAHSFSVLSQLYYNQHYCSVVMAGRANNRKGGQGQTEGEQVALTECTQKTTHISNNGVDEYIEGY